MTDEAHTLARVYEAARCRRSCIFARPKTRWAWAILCASSRRRRLRAKFCATMNLPICLNSPPNGTTLARLHALETQDRPAHLMPWANWANIPRFCAHGHPHPVFELAIKWLADNVPPWQALLSGRFSHGHQMVAPEQGVVAILDWELAHIGDPMEDLGWPCVPSWRFGQHQSGRRLGQREDFYAAYEAAGGAIDRAAVRFGNSGHAEMGHYVHHDGDGLHIRCRPHGGRAAIGRRASKPRRICCACWRAGLMPLTLKELITQDKPDIADLMQAVRISSARKLRSSPATCVFCARGGQCSGAHAASWSLPCFAWRTGAP